MSLAKRVNIELVVVLRSSLKSRPRMTVIVPSNTLVSGTQNKSYMNFNEFFPINLEMFSSIHAQQVRHSVSTNIPEFSKIFSNLNDSDLLNQAKRLALKCQ